MFMMLATALNDETAASGGVLLQAAAARTGGDVHVSVVDP
jgi:hypothetical protein